MSARTAWATLPPAVTSWVESELGETVQHALSQANGFSPGTADRVGTPSGRRAFVKALSREHNEAGYEIHRREALVMRSLPASVRAPRLLSTFDDGEWVALLLEDIDGTHPLGDDPSAVRAVLDALAELPPAVGELSRLPRATDELRGEFEGWDRLERDGDDTIFSDAARGLRRRMMSLSSDAADAVDGNYLVHLDCRADNLLVDGQGDVWLIDWPWACAGAAWLDALTYLLDVSMQDHSVDVEEYLDHRVFASMTAHQADAVLAGLAGAFYDKARSPAPSGMAALRGFQKAEADAAARWLGRRWGVSPGCHSSSSSDSPSV